MVNNEEHPEIAAAGFDYGLGLCHTCVKELIAFRDDPTVRPGAKPNPSYAITMATALVPVPVPGDTDDTAYYAAVPMPACIDHLSKPQARRPKPPPPLPPLPQRRLIVPS
jgi:hypothetical protein